MRKILFILILALLPVLAFSQVRGGSDHNDKAFTVCSLEENVVLFGAEGGPVSVSYFNLWGKTYYSLIVFSTNDRDEAISVTMGYSLEDALEWLDGMAIASGFYVGSIFNVMPDENAGESEKQMVKVGDRRFYGVGEYHEKGSSIIFIPNDKKYHRGTYGVHKSTFKQVRRKLARVGKKKKLP